MRRLVLFIFEIIYFLSIVPLVNAQSERAIITLHDRSGSEISSLVDGNQIQAAIKLQTTSQSSSVVKFYVEGIRSEVTQCSIQAGKSECSTDLFTTLGWYWGDVGKAEKKVIIHAEINGSRIPGEQKINIRPRPVVMVHGFLSSWDTWKAYLGRDGFLSAAGIEGFAVGDGQAPGVLNTGNTDDPSARTNSIAQNAAVLKGYIDAVQQKTGAEKVDLLVHSMGGMITRYYLDRLMEQDNIAQVIFLGTPMAGSACVYPLAALGYLAPASMEILPDYMMNIFDKQITHRHGVPFYMIAGTLLVEPITSPCADAPSDTVVALDSATFIQLDGIQKLPLFHGGMTSDRQVFTDYVLHLLQNSPASFFPRPDPDTNPVSSGVMQYSRVYTGHLKKGDSEQVTINIDSGVSLANFSLYDDTRSVDVEVKGASGKTIHLDLEHNGLIKIDDPDVMLYLGYGFKQPKPGKWIVTLKTTEKTPVKGLNYAVNARFSGGAVLNAASAPTIPARGQAVEISAAISSAAGDLTGVRAEAAIRKPDGRQEILPMQSGGEKYSVKYLPDQTGIYGVEVRINGINSDGFEIDRAAFLAFETQPGEKDIYFSRSITIFIVVMILALIMIWIWFRRSNKLKPNSLS